MAKSKGTAKKATKKTSGGILRRLLRNKRITALLVVLAVAIAGTWQLTSSSAYTYDLSPSQCFIRGRDGVQTTKYSYRCDDTCRNGAGSPVKVANKYIYCSAAVSPGIAKDKCVNILRRHYIGDIGCARRWQQTNQASAIQCIQATQGYTVASPFDYCGAPPATGGSSGGAWIWPSAMNAGVGGFGSGHYARDFSGDQGTAVRSVADGTVVWKGSMGYACGNGIIIRSERPSGGSTYAVYEHINFSSTSSGAVSQGTTIGYMAAPPAGSSGGCWTGYHVHVGIQTHGTYIESHRSTYHADPCDYVTGC